MRLKRLALMIVLALAMGWSGPERLPLLGDDPNIRAVPIPLDPNAPDKRQVGALTYLGGVELWSRDGAFGGFSSLTVAGDRFTLLSDGGGIVRFRMDAGLHVSAPEFAELPAGPGQGWQKVDRDSESMTADPAGQVWVGFETTNQIWRYAPNLTSPAAGVAPRAMRGWVDNGGAESMVRLHDGRFLAIAEVDRRPGSDARNALLFDDDPVAQPDRGFRFGYLPPAGYDPSDATELPDGRVLVLNRRLSWPFRWSAVLTLIDPRQFKPGAIVKGKVVATFDPPLNVDNFEGLAITREGAATILWMVSDDNQFVLERTLLMKFRVDL
ncbi:esterase-like activity of phytase family protein [Sphingomonas sp.]|jgi:hypothetical protein|uniref:esterase-like activity of phytase family protein n=1 Tax=Sphingomonas sp. TaxID=28214 RepID=UPI002E380710|nr:esterase-like activity of phytase family protein [Sphingomonas sp.]HEX4694364.1 esterase-like activity of phytase family protein [Sphingomonas sp.]